MRRAYAGRERPGRANDKPNATRYQPGQNKENNKNKHGGNKGAGKKPSKKFDKQCINCDSKEHYTKDCTKPRVTCDHPMCEGNHLRKFCWWRHPELIKNDDLRATFKEKIAKYEREKGGGNKTYTARRGKATALSFTTSRRTSRQKSSELKPRKAYM